MGNGYVETGVRRTIRNLLIANLVLLAGVLVVALLNRRYLYNFAFGPFPMDREALLSLKNPDALQDYWVTIQADQVTDTGVDAIHVAHSRSGTSRSVVGRYVLANFGTRELLVKAPTGYTGTAFTGALQPIADDEEDDKINSLIAQMPDQSHVLSFMLVSTDFHTEGALGVAIGIVLTYFALLNLWKVIRRTANPEAHPLYQALSTYGSAAFVAVAVDAEVAGPKAIRFGSTSQAVLTPHWLLLPSTFGIQAVHLDDLVWVYEQVIQGKTKSYAAVLWTDRDTHTVIHDNEYVVTSILNHVQEHAPWAKVGMAPELVKSWRTDRPAMLQQVADRQRAIKAQLS